MRRTQPAVHETRASVIRSVLAAALLLCVLSGALPAEAALNPYGLMPCCRGLAVMAGECHSNSCPMYRRAGPKGVRRDLVCGARNALQAFTRKTLDAPQTHSEDARPRDQAQTKVEQDHGGNVSSRNTPQSDSRRSSAVGASLTRPCASDCCAAAVGSFADLRRPRHEAALNESLRPHPPATESHRSRTSGITKAASALRRSHTPRAPPLTLDSRTA